VTTNRHRETERRYLSQYTVSDYNPGSGSPSSVSTGNSGRHSSGTFKSIDDVSIPWREYQAIKRSNGGICLHAMALHREDRTCVPSAWSFGEHPVWGRRTVTGTMACELSQSPSGPEWAQHLDNLANAQALAITEAYAKMNSPDALIRVMFNEREKTVKLIGSAASRAARFLDELKVHQDLALLKGKTVVQSLSSGWLLARFGVRPTLADIDDAAKAAAHVKPSSRKVLVSRGGTQIEFKGSYGGDVSTVGGVVASRFGNWSETAKVSSGVFYAVKDVSDAGWKAQCNGITARDIPSTYWEEIPYSWLVDYFDKVGLWLQAAIPNPFIDIFGDWTTTVRKQQVTCYVPTATIMVNTPPATLYTSGGGTYVENIDSVDRRIGGGVPSYPPRSVKPLSFSQSLDIAALAVQHCSKTLKSLRI